MEINELVQKAHQMAKEKGFWDNKLLGPYHYPEDEQIYSEPNIPEKLALIHSEISEALEAYRSEGVISCTLKNGKPEGFGIELADAVIRIADLCGYLNIHLADLIEEKMIYNASRIYKHGKNF